MASLGARLLQVARNLETYAHQQRFAAPEVPEDLGGRYLEIYRARCLEYCRALRQMAAQRQGKALAREVTLLAQQCAIDHNETLALDPGSLDEEQRVEAIAWVYASDKLLGDLEAIAGISAAYHEIPSLLVVQPIVGTSQIVHPARSGAAYRLLCGVG